MKTIPHHAPTLGAEIVGLKGKDTGLAIFRGIPFASVTKRWTQSCMQNTLPSPFDATKFGPKCSQALHESIVPVTLTNPDPGEDEFQCLNLNITVPEGALPEGRSKQTPSLLPVMVWVHGGGFKNGSNSAARYQPQILSTVAKEAGQPVVIVQIQYRLGPFGFHASEDLAMEHASMSSDRDNKSPDYFGNFGMVDQRNAFEWVQNHIQDFGGDPSNVTAFGLSAGSGSLHMHILGGNPLFDRAILMSGSAPMMGPLPLETFQAKWNILCQKAGVLKEPGAKRLEHLRSLSTDALIQMSGSAAIPPMADGKLLPKSWPLGASQPPTRCKEIIIGSSRVEAIIFDPHVRHVPQKLFQQIVRSAFAEASDADKFCQYFGFASDEQPFEAFRDAIRFFLSTVIFHFPNLRVAETFSGKTYLYHFEEPSPYPGPTNGIPVHGLCAVFMYGNDKGAWPESAHRTSAEMANLWTAFAHGKEPWGAYDASKHFMRFGPNGEHGLMTSGDDKIRDYGYLDWLREHFKEVSSLVFKLEYGLAR